MLNNIYLILKREFSMKIRNRMFWIMALLGPFLLAGIMIVPVGLNMESKEHKIIEVLDMNSFNKDSLNIHQYFTNTDEVSYVFMHGEPQDIKNIFLTNSSHDALVIMQAYPSQEKVQFYAKSVVGQEIITTLEKSILNFQKDVLLHKKANLSSLNIQALNQQFSIKTETMNTNAYEEMLANTASSIGLTAGILIYFFILLYGIQVMRGIIEEKSNRILEVLVTSVKPFELMMGKILGIGLVSLLQFGIWIGISSTISVLISSYFKLEMYNTANINHTLTFVNDASKAMEINMFMTSLSQINLPFVIVIFLSYFVFAYLLYAALFAAIGSAVDAETDTQQFVLPITIPLLISFVMAQSIITNPDSSMAFYLSMIPFTSPIVMMLRLPFGVDLWQVVLSLLILISTFLAATYFSSKVFKTGILMYGKKVSLKELVKWMLY